MNENREQIAQLPPEGTALTVQIAPFGSFPGTLRGTDGKSKSVTQVLDEATFTRIIENWQKEGSKELLVDVDHDSMGGSTRAFAWATNLKVDPERGLTADFNLTDLGRGALEKREYRFVSPVFTLGEKSGEILALDSIALTNRPNLPVSCVLNRETTGVQPVEDKKENPTMEKILSALGLNPEATEDDACAAIDALKKAVDEANKKVLENEAEAVAEENKDKVANREAFVKLYVQNGRDTALAFLAAVKVPEALPPQKRIVANSAQTPADTPSVKERLANCRSAEELAAFAVANAKELAQIVH